MRHLTSGIILLLVTGLAWAESPGVNADAAALVRQLGTKKFADREDAEKKLIALGSKAIPAVRTGITNSDAEVARRCQALIPRIRDAQRTAFLAGKLDWPGPVGKKFRETIGDDEASRKLFGEVLKVGACWDVIDRLADSPEEAPKAYAAELTRLAKEWKAALEDLRARQMETKTEPLKEESRKRIQPGDVILILLLESFRKPEDAKVPLRLYELLSASFMDLARGPLREPFVKLFLVWLERQNESGNLFDGLQAALCAPISEAVPVARRELKDPKPSLSMVLSALLLLGHCGTESDLNLIRGYRDDTRNIQGYVFPNGEIRKDEVRDIAAAMSLKLCGQKLASFGFDVQRNSPWWAEPKFYERPLPFPTAEAREAALKRAWEWLDERAKERKK